MLTGLLRDELGYRGLILTDALDMQAIKKDRTAAEAATLAFEAGADMLLIAGIDTADRGRAGDGPAMLLAAVRSGRVPLDRLDASVLRILAAKARRGILSGASPGEPTGLNSPEHRALALEVARKAVTLHRDAQSLLPLRPAQRVLVVVPDAPTRSYAQDDQLASNLLEAVQQFAPAASDALDSPDVIVLGAYDLAQSADQQAVARSLVATGKPVVAVSLRGPYDAPVVPGIHTWLTVYGDRPVHLQAAAEALFGKLTPGGQAP